ncbi:hypothetical protein [Ideonella sp.]|jgi:hypothetical protein|uniref:hypothetical protein n=1 Tax=Ideonella sp. TaxID=1929293 RepID=UPI0037C0A5D4
MQPIDLGPILEQIIASDIVQAVMSVGATIAGIYAVIFAVMNLLAMLRGEEAWSWGLSSHLDWFSTRRREQQFERQYEIEQRSHEYREWKKSKGLR